MITAIAIVIEIEMTMRLMRRLMRLMRLMRKTLIREENWDLP
jgi:hypothetical protein